VSIRPIIPAKNTSAVTRPPLNARLRNRLGVTSGETPARSRRRSTTTNTPSNSALAPMETNVQAGQSSSRPWISG
jgi:hypothetical protein